MIPLKRMSIKKLPLERIRDRLDFIYGPEVANDIMPQLTTLLGKYREKNPPKNWENQLTQRDAMLFTYGDSIISENQTPLATLDSFLGEHFSGLLNYVHLLPFYPWTSDDGFAVTNFREVNPTLGEWTQIEELASKFQLVFDGVINHVSASSEYVRGFCKGDPAYENFCLSVDTEVDLSGVFRTRNLPLLHAFETNRGEKHLWTTFGPDQVDLNYQNPKVLLEILDVMLFYASKGASMVRLDAIPYLWKEIGSSCIHLPKTHEIIKLIRDVYDEIYPEVLLLSECNVPHPENISYLGEGGDEAQMVYNFALPPLILLSLIEGDGTALSDWAGELILPAAPCALLNITATHDGIGMRATEDLLSEEKRTVLIQRAKDHGGDITGKRNSDGSVSPYELNITYFDALNKPIATDSSGAEPIELQISRFMCSQIIALSFAGMPGIYLQSLIGSRNDEEGVKLSGRARSINRKQHNFEELQSELRQSDTLRKKVLERYQAILKIRKEVDAFHPHAAQEVLDWGSAFFAIERMPESGENCLAIHHLRDEATKYYLAESYKYIDLITGDTFHHADGIDFEPYQCRWLIKRY